MSDPLAARLVVGVEGPALSPREAAWLERWRPAGVILFGRNVTGFGQLRALCRSIHACLGPAAEIAADHEGGPVSVCAAALGRPPTPWGLGLLDDPDLTRRVHAETAQRLRAVGVTRVLGPCADVLVEPRNPVIGVRAFGATPQRVARHLVAAVAGLREGGVGSCLKHWPGHGGTAGDSHATAVDTGAGALDAPFASGLAAGADAVMVGHLPDPLAAGSSPTGGRVPATLDPAALARLRALAPARAPLVYADDVTMGALRAALAARGVAVPPAEATGMVAPAQLTAAYLAAVAAAGCDRLLCRGIPWGAFAPAPDGRTATQAVGREADLDEADAPGPSVVYAQALRRLAASAGGDPFPPGASRRLWLDTTAGDRWGDAAAVAACWRGRGELTGLDVAPPTMEAQALLVTAHRPLAPVSLAALRAPGRLARTGGCLALGHPSLAVDLSGALPAGWRLTALPDLDPELCAGWSAGWSAALPAG